MAKFQYVLAAAIFVMLLFSFYADYESPERDIRENETDKYLVTENFGWIGESETTSRNIMNKERLDITYESPNRTLESFDSMQVQKGFPRDTVSKTVDLEMVEPENLYIVFTVEDANHHGDLEFSIDGELIKSFEPEKGRRHTVKISDLESGSSTLRISAEESPSHVFWTANSYSLRDVDIILEDYAVQKNIETFRIHDYELTGFDRGSIEFYVREDTEAVSPLLIDINGNTVFERSPVARPTSYNAEFSKSEADLSPGENVVSIYSSPDVNYRLENLNVDIHYITTTDRTTVETSFELPFLKYQFLSEEEGVIEYYVENRGVGEELEITLPNNEFVQTPRVGWNEIRFSKDDVDRGENTVQLTTSGSYEISDFRVFIDE